MTRDEAIATLRVHAASLRARGVQHAAVFGSVARGDQRAGSDIDILIELDPDRTIDVYTYVGLKRFIGELFPSPVDVVDREALKGGVAETARREAAYAF
jgi:predicted nucleotidyltransferase